jgi:hypothetical protein
VCLFGVCVHLTTQAPGRYSIDGWRARRAQLAQLEKAAQASESAH